MNRVFYCQVHVHHSHNVVALFHSLHVGCLVEGPAIHFFFSFSIRQCNSSVNLKCKVNPVRMHQEITFVPLHMT